MAAEDELYEMSDEELEAAFKEARASEDGSAEDVVEEEIVEDEVVEEIVEETIDEDEDEIVDELEQPEDGQDSDDDASSEDDEEEESDENSEETEEGELDGEPEEDEDEPTDDEEEPEAEEQPVQVAEKIKVKANGKEYDFTESEMKEQFGKVFGQAMDYTKKMQAMKPDRKKLDIIQQTGMSEEDLNLFADVLKGDKGAINEVIKRTGVDTLELESEENKYTPKDYGRDDTTLAIKDVIDDISADTEYSITHNILSKEWDEQSWGEVSQNPEMIRLLHMDVKSGMYDRVQPIADKLKLYGKGSKSDIDYYKEAAGVYFNEEAQENARIEAAQKAEADAEVRAAEKAKVTEVKAKQAKRTAVKTESQKRKAAAPTKKAAGTKKGINYLDDSDEAFEEWYNTLEDS